jgi:hypothetical protein
MPDQHEDFERAFSRDNRAAQDGMTSSLSSNDSRSSTEIMIDCMFEDDEDFAHTLSNDERDNPKSMLPGMIPSTLSIASRSSTALMIDCMFDDDENCKHVDFRDEVENSKNTIPPNLTPSASTLFVPLAAIISAQKSPMRDSNNDDESFLSSLAKCLR